MALSKNTIYLIVLLACSTIVALLVSEAVLRVKNSSMTNYDIEMWRYARELKVKRSDPSFDCEHLKNKTAVLQNVKFASTNGVCAAIPFRPSARTSAGSFSSALRRRAAGACTRRTPSRSDWKRCSRAPGSPLRC